MSHPDALTGAGLPASMEEPSYVSPSRQNHEDSRVYLDRIVGCHRDYRDFGVHAAAVFGQSEESSKENDVSFQSKADWHGVHLIS